MLKNKNILITGGAGFIGTHLFESLIKENNYIVIIDNFNNCYYSGKEENLASVSKSFEILKDYKIIKGDLLNKSIFDEITCEIDVIFHLAAHAGVRYSIQNSREVTSNNILGTINIFDFALKNNVEKVVYASSSSVYGNPIYTPVDEDHPKNPISPYAVSKLCGEIFADYFYREYNLPVTSLRFYTVYGPRGRPDMAIGKFFNLILQNKELIIYGDGEQLRDFTYISDIVEGLILSGENNNVSGEYFNLGYSKPISVNQLVGKMYSIAEKPMKVKHIEKQKGDVDVTYSDIKKAQSVLNYKPKVSIDDGLRKTYENQLGKGKK
jgi:nucleoside-diphosphate-sugar epimerase